MEDLVLLKDISKRLNILQAGLPLILAFLTLHSQLLLQATDGFVLLHDLLLHFLNGSPFLIASVCRFGVLVDDGLGERQFVSGLLD